MTTFSKWMRSAIVWLALTLTACLPADTRPPPGIARVFVSADDALISGFPTSDGWSIAYDRFFVSLGEVDLDGSDCVPFAESDYLRLFDMRLPGAHTVNTIYALGPCQFRYRLEPPTSDVVLSPGVDEATKLFMLSPGSDLFATARGITLHVAGTAIRADVSYRFAWSFRREIAYRDCGVVFFSADDPGIVEIRIRGETLFHDGTSESAQTKFDPIAAADTDGDRDVTLEELDAQTIASDEPFETLADLLYLGLLPRVPRFRDMTSCRIDPGRGSMP